MSCRAAPAPPGAEGAPSPNGAAGTHRGALPRPFCAPRAHAVLTPPVSARGVSPGVLWGFRLGVPGGGGGLGCLQGELCTEPCKGLLQQVSLTFQSVLEAVLVHWKRNGELLVGNWAGTACGCRGSPSWESTALSSPHPVGSRTAARLQLSASSQPVPVHAR